MKICSKCGKESTGKFCAYCGEKLINREKKTKNKLDIFIYVSVIQLIVIISMVIYIIYNYNVIDKLETSIQSYETQVSSLKNKNKSLEKKNNEYYLEILENEDKLDFFDEKIVFVLDGYGNYYYTYDQVEQVTQGKEYSFWAYNIEAAKSQGYRAWK